MYKEEWNYQVKSVYRHSHYKATFVIETTSEKLLMFSPIQGIVSKAEIGDRIIKKKNSEIALLIKNNDTIESRIFSPSCDEEVIKNNKHKIVK